MQVAASPADAPAFTHWQASAFFASAEKRLEAERSQLAPWSVVAFGLGIALWLVLADPSRWLALLLGAGGALVAGLVLGGRTGRALATAAVALALGLSLIWWRSDRVAAPRLDSPRIVAFEGEVLKAERLVARDSLRLLIAPADAAIPPRVRVSIPLADADRLGPRIGGGAKVRLRARLAPPMPMALPGTHDFSRDAWFMGLGATGKALGQITILRPAHETGLDAFRRRLDGHIRARLPGGEGGIATALVTGDQGSVSEADADAMRRSGLAHLLSVSGLHIAAVVGFFYFLVLRLFALVPALALRWNLVALGFAAGALAGVAYTILTGLQVPTVRSCIAALLVLAGTLLGREALSIRLIATGALAVLVVRPEAIAGASFQLSFAAVTALVTLYQWPAFKRWFERREEGRVRASGRVFGAMIATGLAVEIALMPFALYHFHRSGLYGVAANLVAIPLTTFVIMPLEAAALLLDSVGLGGPLWSLTGWSIGLLLGLAHTTANASGAVVILPAMPRAAFALIVAGGLWLCLWIRPWRRWGLAPIAAGILLTLAEPLPTLLVTGDGKHLAVIDERGTPWLLRDRAGDFVRDMMAENAGFDGDPPPLAAYPRARCSADACVADLGTSGRTLLALRSTQRLDWVELTRACAAADIVVADRRLPRGCRARWLTLDAPRLRASGGLVVHAEEGRVASVADRLKRLPWARP
ncbi:ComEC/Rec2 family competence protein [Sphingomonas sp. LHG3406-1]|uniref:ComEC/Rec2 family competence protein n=1 Tax=Sphingomonas sp. LHG3406-1 TaxID=2804617 RepID=UPI0026256E00|nr:ComEC/Rec2 family competence protein [Sphingomonas sp. LHG3406-1]